MNNVLRKKLIIYSCLNLFGYVVSYFALVLSKVFTMNTAAVIVCFILGIISFLISPYLVLLFKKCGNFIAVISGFLGPSVITFVNVFSLSSKNDRFKILLVAGAVVLVSLVFILIYKIKKINKENRKIKEILKSFQIFITAVCVLAIVFSIPTGLEMNKILSNNLPDDSNVISSTVKATNDADTKDQSLINAHLDELMPIIDGTYQDLSVQERLDMFQRVVNIECTYFGSSIAVSVKMKPFPSNQIDTYAYYSESEKRIYINENLFQNIDVDDALFIVLHECYHIYQSEQKKLFESVPEEFKNLMILNEAKMNKEGLDDYISAEENYDEYKNQFIEKQADDYAYSEMLEYERLIEQYSSDADFK